jgi:hypothetical protein
MLVLLVAITTVGLFETSRRNRLADWHQQQANACTQAVVEFEERAESLMEAGQEADAESCLRSAAIFTRQEEAHETMAQRLRQPFWQDWLPK